MTDMATSAKAIARARILIAEDSPTQAQRLQHMLTEHGYEVRVAANGRIALEAMVQFQPALIISDVLMPEMDGYELAHSIKSNPALKDVPIILVTTMSDPEDVIRGLECGADNFVLKPYNERYLLGRVQYVLINREFRRSQDVGMGVEVYFNGQKHYITADRLQILNLLLSTYDAAIQRNRQLGQSEAALRSLNERLDAANAELKQRAAALEAANKELEAFSYSVSHDLRAPLRHIDAYIEMLQDSMEGQLQDTPQRYLDVIVDASRHMSKLIDDLLEFSRMARADMRESIVSLDSIVQETVRILQPAQGERHIEWRIATLPAVIGDPAMLRQVFSNLLDNALKYTAMRATARIEVGCQAAQDGRVIVFVRDNGAGFDMSYKHKLFRVFERLHSAEQFKGTGIGLASVARIVERHGGSVWAEGAPDEGAAFYLTLQRAE